MLLLHGGFIRQFEICVDDMNVRCEYIKLKDPKRLA